MKTLFISLIFSGFSMAAQQSPYDPDCYIQGRIVITIGSEREGVFDAQVELLLQGVDLKGRCKTDADGNFRIGPVNPGFYSLQIVSTEIPEPKIIPHIPLSQGQTLNLGDVFLSSVTEVIVIKSKPKEKYSTCMGLSSSEISRAPVRRSGKYKIGDIIDGKVHSKGGRDNSNAYYVNGVQMNTAPNLPRCSYEIPTGQKPSEFSDVPAPQEFNTENYDRIYENDWQLPTREPLSTFSIDVDPASYSNVRRFLHNGQLPPKDAVRIEEMINYFSYDYPQPKDDVPFSTNTEVSVCPWDTTHRLVQIGLQGRMISYDNLPASNLVFLVDVSGSMQSENKLPLVKSALKLLVGELRPNDKVSLVVYAGAAGLVLPSTPGSEKQKIINALYSLDAGGSTAGGEGILLAYKIAKQNFIENGNNRVILATDGDFNVGLSSEGELERLIEEKRKEGVYLTVLGFGMGNYQDSKMQLLADKGNGNHAYIDDIGEAKKVLVDGFGGTLFTIAKDVKLQIEWNPQNVKSYRLIGYENRMLAAQDFNDDKKDAGELGSGHTVTALYEIVPVTSSLTADISIDSLRYQPNFSATSQQFKNELMTLKLRHKLPKDSTSHLIVHTVSFTSKSFEEAGENLRWSASVAAFGLLLRESAYKGTATYNQAKEWAKKARGEDEDGYRSEMIRLIDLAEKYHGIASK